MDDYIEMRDRHIARNLYLYVFEISAPTSFGISWAQGHLKEVVPDLVKPSKKLDPNYSGQYDFFLDGKIRLEVKASRAVDEDSDAPLYAKALTAGSDKRFLMNFQQLKPACCEVFVWVAAWTDVIRYWVMSSAEVSSHECYQEKHHRGNKGEGQFHVTHKNINKIADFEVRAVDLLAAIRDAYARQQTATGSVS